MAKKCCVPDCIRDAVMVPQIKRGPVFAFIEPAEKALGFSRSEALQNETIRQRVLENAKGLAYTKLTELACCTDCMVTVAKDERCKITDAGALMFLPFTG